MRAKHDSKKIAEICEFMRMNWFYCSKKSCAISVGVTPAVITQVIKRRSYARYIVQYEQGLFFDLKNNLSNYRDRFLKMKKALEDGYSTPPPPPSMRSERGNTNEEVYQILEKLYSKGNPIAARNSDEKSLLLFRCYNKEHLWWLEQKNNAMLKELS